jgi:type VI protein secretion system component Hcp
MLSYRDRVAALGILLLASAAAQAGPTLRLEGVTPMGSNRLGAPARTQEFQLLTASFAVASPAEAAAGRAAGREANEPLIVTLPYDADTRAELAAVQRGERFNSAIVNFTQQVGASEIVYLTAKLTDVQITQFRITELANGQSTVLLNLSYMRSELQWANLPGAKGATDDWQTPGR